MAQRIRQLTTGESLPCSSDPNCGRQASLIAQVVKNLPAMPETPAQLLGQEDLLEKGQAARSSILGLAWWLSW